MNLIVYYDYNYLEYDRFFYTHLGLFEFSYHIDDLFNLT